MSRTLLAACFRFDDCLHVVSWVLRRHLVIFVVIEALLLVWALCPCPDVSMKLLGELFEPHLRLILAHNLILHNLLAQLVGLLGEPTIVDWTLALCLLYDSLPMTV